MIGDGGDQWRPSDYVGTSLLVRGRPMIMWRHFFVFGPLLISIISKLKTTKKYFSVELFAQSDIKIFVMNSSITYCKRTFDCTCGQPACGSMAAITDPALLSSEEFALQTLNLLPDMDGCEIFAQDPDAWIGEEAAEELARAAQDAAGGIDDTTQACLDLGVQLPSDADDVLAGNFPPAWDETDVVADDNAEVFTEVSNLKPAPPTSDCHMVKSFTVSPVSNYKPILPAPTPSKRELEQCASMYEPLPQPKKVRAKMSTENDFASLFYHLVCDETMRLYGKGARVLHTNQAARDTVQYIDANFQEVHQMLDEFWTEFKKGNLSYRYGSKYAGKGQPLV
jgi:hypothetical protein